MITDIISDILEAEEAAVMIEREAESYSRELGFSVYAKADEMREISAGEIKTEVRAILKLAESTAEDVAKRIADASMAQDKSVSHADIDKAAKQIIKHFIDNI